MGDNDSPGEDTVSATEKALGSLLGLPSQNPFAQGGDT